MKYALCHFGDSADEGNVLIFTFKSDVAKHKDG